MKKTLTLMAGLLMVGLVILPAGLTSAEDKPGAQTGAATTAVQKKELPPPLSVTGTITKVDKEAGSFELTVEGETAPKVFKASPKLLDKIAVDQKVVVHYRTTKAGENKALAVKPAKKPKEKPKKK